MFRTKTDFEQIIATVNFPSRLPVNQRGIASSSKKVLVFNGSRICFFDPLVERNEIGYFSPLNQDNGSHDWTAVDYMVSCYPECIFTADCLCAHWVRISFFFQQKSDKTDVLLSYSDLTKPAQLTCKISLQ
jgi:hypothetical protein